MNNNRIVNEFIAAKISIERAMKSDKGYLLRTQAVSQLARNYPDNWRILDIGCGEGQLLNLLNNRIKIGIDISFTRCQLTKNRNLNAGYCQTDCLNLPFADNSFDLIVGMEVFEHLMNPAHALKEAARLLKPDGIIITTFPNQDKLNVTKCQNCGKLVAIDNHFHTFDRISAASLLACFFEILEFQPCDAIIKNRGFRYFYNSIGLKLRESISKIILSNNFCQPRWLIFICQKRKQFDAKKCNEIVEFYRNSSYKFIE